MILIMLGASAVGSMMAHFCGVLPCSGNPSLLVIQRCTFLPVNFARAAQKDFRDFGSNLEDLFSWQSSGGQEHKSGVGSALQDAKVSTISLSHKWPFRKSCANLCGVWQR